MLSGKELFRYRSSLEKTVPQKGGLKDFMPDGSWLQSKRLEKFHEERQNVLTEPRVQRKCDLVKGEWNPDSKLVELYQNMKNFFDNMGFTGGNRKWLYPEEALFLMETSILEVWYRDMPLSIQQAYQMLLCGPRSVELYQVYSHLRRVGYIVLHHRGRLKITKYERQIGLDQYTNKKIKKSKHIQHRGEDTTSTEEMTHLSVDSDTEEKYCESPTKSTDESMKASDLCDPMSDQEVDTNDSVDDVLGEMCEDREVPESEGIVTTTAAVVSHTIELDEMGGNGVVQEDHDVSNTSAPDATAVTDAGIKHRTIQKDQEKDIKLERSQGDGKESKAGDEEICDIPPSEGEASVRSMAGINGTSEKNGSGMKDMSVSCSRKLSQWDFKEVVFPNFSSDKDVIIIPSPDMSKFPVDVEGLNKSEYQFVKNKFINTKRVKRNYGDLEGDEVLEFSYSNIVTGQSDAAKSAKNWKEYKCQIEQDLASLDCRNIVPHLYSNELEPLVKPEHAVSTRAVLEQLHVVKEEALRTGSAPSRPPLLPDFDVYAPNMQFRKSSPGVPDHRVCVVRSSDPPPELSTVHAISSYLNDDVPLHWAVVDNGDIAFYAISDFLLPQDINMG